MRGARGAARQGDRPDRHRRRRPARPRRRDRGDRRRLRRPGHRRPARRHDRLPRRPPARDARRRRRPRLARGRRGRRDGGRRGLATRASRPTWPALVGGGGPVDAAGRPVLGSSRRRAARRRAPARPAPRRARSASAPGRAGASSRRPSDVDPGERSVGRSSRVALRGPRLGSRDAPVRVSITRALSLAEHEHPAVGDDPRRRRPASGEATGGCRPGRRTAPAGALVDPHRARGGDRAAARRGARGRRGGAGGPARARAPRRRVTPGSVAERAVAALGPVDGAAVHREVARRRRPRRPACAPGGPGDLTNTPSPARARRRCRRVASRIDGVHSQHATFDERDGPARTQVDDRHVRGRAALAVALRRRRRGSGRLCA